MAVVLLLGVVVAVGPAQAADKAVPGRPTGVQVQVEPGSLAVAVSWDDMGADEYLVRWRQAGDGHALNEGVRVAETRAEVTVESFGQWVVRVEACNDEVCGLGASRRFTLRPAQTPEPTPEATPEPTPEPTPEATPEPTPEAMPEPTPEPTPEAVDEPEVAVPARVSGLRVNTVRGSSVVAVSWDATSGADEYWVRWRRSGTVYLLSEGMRVADARAEFEVDGTGDWVVRVEACNQAGCGLGSARRFMTRPAPEPENRAPTVDAGAASYGRFAGVNNAPRGILVHKFFDGIFSDPDGDELAYTATVGGEWAELSSIIHVRTDRHLLFFEADPGADWAEMSPMPPNPVVFPVTLTATDPDGLSASVTAVFSTHWEKPAPVDVGVPVCDRTPQVRDALVALLGMDCGQISDADLATVEVLDLSNAGITGLQEGDFDGLTGMYKLNLSNNPRLGMLPPIPAQQTRPRGLSGGPGFSRTHGLSAMLRLQGTDPCANEALTDLLLGRTGLTGTLAADSFSTMGCLLFLDLSGNAITAINVDAFDGLTRLKWLDIQNTNITTLPAGVFDDPKATLLDLSLSRNASLNSLPSNLFDGLDVLERLWVDHTSLSSIPADLFNANAPVKLKYLNLGYNKLPSSPSPFAANAFAGLTALEELWLVGNPGAPFDMSGKGVRSEADVTGGVPPLRIVDAFASLESVEIHIGVPASTNVDYRCFITPSPTLAFTQPTTGACRWSSPSATPPVIPAWTRAAGIALTTLDGDVKALNVLNLAEGHGYAIEIRAEKSGAVSPVRTTPTLWPGSNNADVITAHSGSGKGNIINGRGGNDTLSSLDSTNDFFGGTGTDTVTYANADYGIIADLLEDANNAGGAAGDTYTSIENLTGSPYNDFIIGSDAANTINGLGGDDEIFGWDGKDTLNGGSGADYLYGGTGDDTLNGGAGNDRVHGGGGGSDSLTGGGGTDTFYIVGHHSGATPSTGSDTIADYEVGTTAVNSESIVVCAGSGSDALSQTGAASSGNWVITVKRGSAHTVGTITLTGKATSVGTNGSLVNISLNNWNHEDCPDPIPGTYQPAWMCGNTPQFGFGADQGGDANTTSRVFLQACTPAPRAVTCAVTSIERGLGVDGKDKNPATINCPPGTLTSIAAYPVWISGNEQRNEGGTQVPNPGYQKTALGERLEFEIRIRLNGRVVRTPTVTTGTVGGPAMPSVAVSAANGRIGVSWTPPSHIGKPNSNIIGYQVAWRTMGYRTPETAPGDWNAPGAWTRSAVLGADTRTHTIDLISALAGTDYPDGLPPLYEISVRARNDATGLGSSANLWGMERRILVRPFDGRYAIAPLPPTSASAAATSTTGELTVSWGAPSETRGANVHYYTVRHKVSTAGDGTYVSQIVPLGGTSVTLTGLTGGTEYTVQIKAHTVAGESDWAQAKGTPAS